MNKYSMKNYFILLLTLAVFTVSSLNAQEVYLSISGSKASGLSGNNLTSNDYWIVPGTNSGTSQLSVFDAALAGSADVIQTARNTSTTYSLYRFEQIYRKNGNEFTEVKEKSAPVFSVTVLDEPIYANRWVDLTQININPDGWILRVSVSDGDDINCYKIQIPGWKIYSRDFSAGLYKINPADEVQIFPLNQDSPTGKEFVSKGEEDSKVYLKDEFGFSTLLNGNWSGWKQKQFEMTNRWGLSLTGSNLPVNTVYVYSKNSVTFWDLSTIITTRVSKPVLNIDQLAGKSCFEAKLALKVESQRGIEPEAVSWIFGNTKFGTGFSSDFDFGNSGKFTITTLLENQNQYFPRYISQTHPVSINAAPTAVISSPKTVVAAGENLVINSDKSSDPEKSVLSRQWFVNGEYRGNQTFLLFSGLVPGNYTVKLIVDDQTPNSSCTNGSTEFTVRVNAQPYVEIVSIPMFSRLEKVEFSANIELDSDNEPLKYKWEGAGIITAKDKKEISIKHEDFGRFPISLTITDNSGVSNSSYTTTAFYIVNAEPVPRFDLITQAAPGNTVSVSGLKTTDFDTKDLEYNWSLSDGRTFAGRDASFQFENPGDYDFTLTVNDGQKVSNSIQSITKSIHINYPPEPVIAGQSVSTSSKQVFSAESSSDADNKIVSYIWDFGDGLADKGKKVTHLFAKSGKYIVKLTVDDGQKQTNSIQSVTHDLVINKYPTADFIVAKKVEPNKPFEVDGSKSFDIDGEVSKYEWLVDGVSAATGATTSLQVSEPGNHTISLKVTDNSGFDDAVSLKSVTIQSNFPPVVKFKTVPEIAEPKIPVVFDATGTNDPDGKIKSVIWKFSDGTVLTGTKVSRIFEQSGIVEFTVSADDGENYGNSVTTISSSILVNNPPIILTSNKIRSNNSRIFLNASSSYDADGHALSFEWLLPNNQKRTESSFYWDAPSGGVHFITLTVNDGQKSKNSISRESIQVLINRPVVAVVDSLVRACTGQTILFNSSLCYDPDGDAFTTKWQFGEGSESTESNPAFVFKKPGLYEVKLFLHDGFSDQPTVATIPVIVEGSPIAMMSFSDTTVCVNSPILFDGTKSTDPNGQIGSYTWDFGDGSTAFGSTVTHLYAEAGVYNVTLNVMGTGSGQCSKVNQTAATVRVVQGPSVSISSLDWVSPNENVDFSAIAGKSNSNILDYTWEIKKDGKVYQIKGDGISYEFGQPGEYWISVTINTDSKTSCNSATDSKKIKVNAKPEIVWDMVSTLAEGERLLLDARKSKDSDGIITKYEWYLDSKLVAIDPVVTVPVIGNGEHQVELKITDNSPTSSRSVSMTKKVTVNSGPKPSFTLADIIYEKETVKFSADKTTDKDGDALTSIWKVDGNSVPANEAVFTGGKHVITLIQNDGKNQTNSVDSIKKEIFVTPMPDLSFELPANAVSGTKLNIREITGDPHIYFLQGGNAAESIELTSVGTATITFIWKPKSEILADNKQTIQIWEPVKFIETREPLTIVWNPSNPSVLVNVPSINRTANHPVSYQWLKNGKVVADGKIAEVPLTKGKNEFVVRVTDKLVTGSVVAETVLVVECE